MKHREIRNRLTPFHEGLHYHGLVTRIKSSASRIRRTGVPLPKGTGYATGDVRENGLSWYDIESHLAEGSVVSRPGWPGTRVILARTRHCLLARDGVTGVVYEFWPTADDLAAEDWENRGPSVTPVIRQGDRNAGMSLGDAQLLMRKGYCCDRLGDLVNAETSPHVEFDASASAREQWPYFQRGTATGHMSFGGDESFHEWVVVHWHPDPCRSAGEPAPEPAAPDPVYDRVPLTWTPTKDGFRADIPGLATWTVAADDKSTSWKLESRFGSSDHDTSEGACKAAVRQWNKILDRALERSGDHYWKIAPLRWDTVASDTVKVCVPELADYLISRGRRVYGMGEFSVPAASLSDAMGVASDHWKAKLAPALREVKP